MKLRHTVADRVAGFVRDWSLPRQFAGEDPTREAAQSTMSRRLRPRLEEADTPIGTEGRAPVPAHFEPVESPVKNPLYGKQSSPVAKI